VSLRSGFTLIELLVVIAIVATLAGLLLPALSAIRDATKQIRCLNNQRQCLLAIMTYAEDWDGLTPPAEGGSAGNLYVSRDWFTTLYREGFLPDEHVSSYDTSCTAFMSSLRLPSTACCPAFKSLTNPTGAYNCTNFGVRWDLNWAWTGLKFGPAGCIRFNKLKANMPYLADTIYTSNLNRAGAYWVPDLQVNTVAVHLVHGRRRAVVAYSDGRTGARDAAQLSEERVLAWWAPP